MQEFRKQEVAQINRNETKENLDIKLTSIQPRMADFDDYDDNQVQVDPELYKSDEVETNEITIIEISK